MRWPAGLRPWAPRRGDGSLSKAVRQGERLMDRARERSEMRSGARTETTCHRSPPTKLSRAVPASRRLAIGRQPLCPDWGSPPLVYFACTTKSQSDLVSYRGELVHFLGFATAPAKGKESRLWSWKDRFLHLMGPGRIDSLLADIVRRRKSVTASHLSCTED